jgi:hypothetical protein
MTQDEAKAALLGGATNTNSEYITVQRATLVIALGDAPADVADQAGPESESDNNTHRRAGY